MFESNNKMANDSKYQTTQIHRQAKQMRTDIKGQRHNASQNANTKLRSCAILESRKRVSHVGTFRMSTGENKLTHRSCECSMLQINIYRQIAFVILPLINKLSTFLQLRMFLGRGPLHTLTEAGGPDLSKNNTPRLINLRKLFWRSPPSQHAYGCRNCPRIVTAIFHPTP